MLPHFVIIGTQKSASSFLHICLADHPQVFMPPGEIPFFESPDYERSSLDDLESSFAGCGDRLCGMLRPSYLGKPEVPARLKKHLPEAKWLVVLRNPRERAVSAYYHYMGNGFLPIRPVRRGMRDLLEGRCAQRYQRSGEILEFGLYAKQLRGFLALFDRRSFFITLHEDIVRDPRLVLRQVYEFLGIDADFQSQRISARPQASIYNLARLWVKHFMNPVIFAYNENYTRLTKKPATPWRTAVKQLYLNIDRGVLARLLPSVPPTLDPELIQRLRSFYRADIDQLEELLGRDLSTWK